MNFAEYIKSYQDYHDQITVGTRLAKIFNAPAKESLALIRKDLKVAMKDGTLLPCAISTRSSRGAGMPGSGDVYFRGKFSEEQETLQEKRISAIVDSYDRSGICFDPGDSWSSSYPYFTVGDYYGKSVPPKVGDRKHKELDAPTWEETYALVGKDLEETLSKLDQKGFRSLSFSSRSLKLAKLSKGEASKSLKADAEALAVKLKVKAEVKETGNDVTIYVTVPDKFMHSHVIDFRRKFITLLCDYNLKALHISGKTVSRYELAQVEMICK